MRDATSKSATAIIGPSHATLHSADATIRESHATAESADATDDPSHATGEPSNATSESADATSEPSASGTLGGTHQFLPEPEGPGQPVGVGRVLQATNQVLEKARFLTEKRIETLTSESELDKLVSRMVPPLPEPPTPGSSSTSAPELSASTPGP